MIQSEASDRCLLRFQEYMNITAGGTRASHRFQLKCRVSEVVKDDGMDVTFGLGLRRWLMQVVG